MWQPANKKFKTFTTGELVMQKIPFQQWEKLASVFEGPYAVKVIDGSGVVYRLCRVRDGQIKPYYGKPSPPVLHNEKIKKQRDD